MSQELRDLFEGANLTLDESKSKKFEGVLATVKGPFGLTEDENRNGRTYTNDFWDHVLSRPENQSRLRERAITGELEHPNSVQASLGSLSHVITDLRVHPDKKEIYGEADILDTPSGRILHTLFKAGVKVGISSRGAGSLEESEEGGKKKKYVKKEDYVFGGFDFVSDPSAPNAYPKLSEGQVQALAESLEQHSEEIKKNKSFYSSFLESLGVPKTILEEQVESTSEDTASDIDETDLETQEATIADLRSKMRQMVERHRGMVSRLANMQERVDQVSDLEAQCETLIESVRIHKGQTKELRQDLARVEEELSEATRRLGEFEGMDTESLRESASREQQLSEKVSRLEEDLQRVNGDLDDRNRRIHELSADVKAKSLLAETKRDKLTDFRRRLLSSLCEHFGCDYEVLVNGLESGFTPEDAVREAAKCSTKHNPGLLPLGEGHLKVEDVVPAGEKGHIQPAIKEARKAKIRAVQGR